MRDLIRHCLLTALAVAAMFWLVDVYDASLRDARFLDGWILLLGCGVQVLFSLRRKFPLLPLGNVSSWMRVHIYAGFFLLTAFALHTQFAWPSGMFETALWALFVILAVSGVFGAYLTRSVPSKLEQNRGGSAFDDFPAAQTELLQRADNLVMGAGGVAASPSITDFYANTLSGFLNGPSSAVGLYRRSPSTFRRLCEEMDSLEKRLDDGGKQTMQAMREVLVEKNRLNNRYAYELLLRLWLFVHIPATYGMIVLAVLHVAVIYAYTAGVP